MRVLVIGCGSIGARRARLLAEMGHEVEGYDAAGIHVEELMDGTDVSSKASLDHMLKRNHAAALICTPPETHMSLALDCLRAGVRGLFIEKPLAVSTDGLDELVGVVAEAGAVSMVACNLRFDARLRDLDGVPIKSVTLRMGQDVKHWSPAHQPVNMILDSIHELDLAVSMLGPIGDIAGRSDTDSAFVEVTHLRGTSTIVLDRTTDPPIRTVTVHDGHKERVVNLWPPDPEMYCREMQHFLDCVEKGEATCNPIERAAETLRWALEVA